MPLLRTECGISNCKGFPEGRFRSPPENPVRVGAVHECMNDYMSFSTRYANYLSKYRNERAMWPFSPAERAKDVRTSCDKCLANAEEIRSLKREVTNLLLDMENLRNNVLRKIQKRKVTEEEAAPARKGGILKPSEMISHGITE